MKPGINTTASTPPASDGRYLAWNSNLDQWEIKHWRAAEKGWDEQFPIDRGAIWSHWLPLPDSPHAYDPHWDDPQ